ncbi:MAG: Sir2 family NAD-dependent protein deacetylase [Pseudomonadota bacterium]
MPTPNDLSDLIRHSQRIVFFTGAGMSTESGIPDFRSPGGVWSKMQPIYFQDFVRSREVRREAWTRVFNRSAGWVGADPNAGHAAIAELNAAGRLSSVITQNVDNLHQASGLPDDRVIELHGNASYAACLSCGARHEIEDLKPRWEADEDITCDVCGGLVKTATISFGQAMPENKMAHAQSEAEASDLFIVLGSSLVVYPAATMPLIAKQTGAKLAIVNREETDQDPLADLVYREEIGDFLTRVVDGL